MRYRDCIIAWTPPDDEEGVAGAIKVGPLPDTTGWSDAYAFTTGGCFTERRDADTWRQIAFMLDDFKEIVVRGRIDPQAAHEAFEAIDEYRATWDSEGDPDGFALDDPDEPDDPQRS